MMNKGAIAGPMMVPRPNADDRLDSALVRSDSLVRAATYACAAGFDADPKMPNNDRNVANRTNVVTGTSRPLRPARMTMPQPSIDTPKPMTPTSISRRRPRMSDWRAQYGALNVQSSAENEKMMATSRSGIWMTRAMAGSTVCSAVLPAATVSSTAKSTANSWRGMEKRIVLLGRPRRACQAAVLSDLAVSRCRAARRQAGGAIFQRRCKIVESRRHPVNFKLRPTNEVRRERPDEFVIYG